MGCSFAHWSEALLLPRGPPSPTSPTSCSVKAPPFYPKPKPSPAGPVTTDDRILTPFSSSLLLPAASFCVVVNPAAATLQFALIGELQTTIHSPTGISSSFLITPLVSSAPKSGCRPWLSLRVTAGLSPRFSRQSISRLPLPAPNFVSRYYNRFRLRLSPSPPNSWYTAVFDHRFFHS